MKTATLADVLTEKEQLETRNLSNLVRLSNQICSLTINDLFSISLILYATEYPGCMLEKLDLISFAWSTLSTRAKDKGFCIF